MPLSCRRFRLLFLLFIAFSSVCFTELTEKLLHIIRVRLRFLTRNNGTVTLQEPDGAECRGCFLRGIGQQTESRQYELKRLLLRKEPFLLCGNVGGSTPEEHPFQHVNLFLCGNLRTEHLQRCPVAAVIVE